MKKIALLGSGLVGNVIAMDLSKEYAVLVMDKNEQALEKLKNKKNISTLSADVTDKKKLCSIIEGANMVISALPGYMAFDVLKNILEQGKNVVDISFYPENALSLDALAKKHHCTAIVDCGVAPGMSNFLAGYHATRMKIEEFICYVGGLPMERKFPFEYKAPFSPSDVIEEYTRPARMKENGKIIIKPALSEAESVYFEGIGTLEAFNTDGLRTLLYTLTVPNMKEKTLRYPGHARLIQALQESGFFNTNEIRINDKSIRPIDITSHLLRNAWKLKEQEEEFTVMRVIIKGNENDKNVCYTYDLFDRLDKTTGFSSMARTTGFVCTAMAHLLLENRFNEKGVFPPELIPKDESVFQYVMTHLEERNVRYHKKTEYTKTGS